MYGEREQKRVIDYLHDNQLQLQAIFITHRHPDHICGLESLQNLYPEIPVIVYDPENPPQNLLFQEAGLSIELIPTPGHKEDAVCYYIRQENTLFSGDTLFQESIGRTDLPGGDMAQLCKSLARLRTLPDNTQIYPGHGYPTSIEHEKEYNPYM